MRHNLYPNFSHTSFFPFAPFAVIRMFNLSISVDLGTISTSVQPVVITQCRVSSYPIRIYEVVQESDDPFARMPESIIRTSSRCRYRRSAISQSSPLTWVVRVDKVVGKLSMSLKLVADSCAPMMWFLKVGKNRSIDHYDTTFIAVCHGDYSSLSIKCYSMPCNNSQRY